MGLLGHQEIWRSVVFVYAYLFRRWLYATQQFEYIKGQGWMEQGEMMVNLKTKDAEYQHLCNWFRLRLKLR
jgi:hypothetical protein